MKRFAVVVLLAIAACGGGSASWESLSPRQQEAFCSGYDLRLTAQLRDGTVAALLKKGFHMSDPLSVGREHCK